MGFPRGQQLGIHLSNHRLRVALFDSSHRAVVSTSVHELPEPLDHMKKSGQFAGLSAAFKGAVAALAPYRASTNRAVLAIGDEEIYIKVLTMPQMSPEEATAAAPHELEPDLPIKAHNMYVDVSVLGESAKHDQMDVMVFAASRTYIDAITASAQEAGLSLVAIEISSAALGRLYDRAHNTFLAIDLGSSHGSITIYENDLIHVTTSINIQNEEWAAQSHAAKPSVKAENLQAQFGPLILDITDKIKAAIRYYDQRVHEPLPIEKIFLSGSAAALPGLDAVISEQVGISCVVGRSPVNVNEQCTTAHLVAIGAALRNTHDEY